MIRIVLAEDHALMRAGTRHILNQHNDFEVVGEAENGQQALDLIKALQPDVAVLDIRMPVLSGIDVVRQLKSVSPNTRALMLTAYDDDEYVLALMEAGASGYLLKTAHEKDLVESIRGVNSGEPVLDPVIAMKIARLWANRSNPVPRIFSEQISPRELEVLVLAAKGMRNKNIADKLGISTRTVEGHFNSIYTKMGVSSRMEAVIEAVARHVVTLSDNNEKQ